MGDSSSVTYSRYFPYLETYIEIDLVGDVVRSLRFPDEMNEESSEDHELLERIDDYLSGTVTDEFHDVAIEFPNDVVAREVLETVRGIPYGENVSVAELVRSVSTLHVDDTADHETIREILHDNPVPLLIPDHRVRDGPSSAPPKVEQRLRSLEKITT